MDSPADDHLDLLLRRSWHAVSTEDAVVDRPVAVMLLDRPLVLVLLAGTIAAFDDQCPHRGAALSLGRVSDDCLVCPYHGWHYDGAGTCVRVPSLDDVGRVPGRAHVRAYPVAVHLGLVWVALEDPLLGLPQFDEHADETMRVVACPPYEWACNATRRIENFLDFAHFPWIHPGILGDPQRPLVPTHTVAQLGPELRVHQTRVEPANDDVKTGGLDVGDSVTSDMDYRVQLPLTAQLHQMLPGGRRYAVWLTVSPVSAARARTFWFVVPGERALAVAVADHAVLDTARQLQELDLDDVARFGTTHPDRSGDHMRSVDGRVVRVPCRDVDRVGEDVVRCDTEPAEPRSRLASLVLEDAFVAQRVDGKDLAGRDRVRGPKPRAGKRPHDTVSPLAGTCMSCRGTGTDLAFDHAGSVNNARTSGSKCSSGSLR